MIWLRIRPAGRSMPIDAEPAPDGNVSANLTAGTGVVLSGALLEAVRSTDEPLYLSHFATCPHAGEWRRK